MSLGIPARPHDATVEATGEVARFDRRPIAGTEHQVGVYPGVHSTLMVGVLLPAELERGGDAQVWEGERSFGCPGLDLAAQEPAANCRGRD